MSGSDPANCPQKLVSGLLLEDPDLRDIVAEFVDGLTERIAELKQAYERLDWELLTSLAHQLKGAGGSYGYPDLSDLGATMEQHFRAGSAGSFTYWLQELEQLTTAARAGLETP